MDNYGVTYAYYSAAFRMVDEAEFARLLPQAVRKLDILTHRRARRLESGDYRLDQFRDAVCNLVNYLHTQEETGQGRGVTSISNDGYSESYAAASPDVAETNLRSVCACWLSGTGLMSAL